MFDQVTRDTVFRRFVLLLYFTADVVMHALHLFLQLLHLTVCADSCGVDKAGGGGVGSGAAGASAAGEGSLAASDV